jgi:hypothetical protein
MKRDAKSITEPSKKNRAAVQLGRLGGLARSKSQTPGQLAAIGRLGAKARNAALSKRERRRISLLAVAARLKKRRKPI